MLTNQQYSQVGGSYDVKIPNWHRGICVYNIDLQFSYKGLRDFAILDVLYFMETKREERFRVKYGGTVVVVIDFVLKTNKNKRSGR